VSEKGLICGYKGYKTCVEKSKAYASNNKYTVGQKVSCCIAGCNFVSYAWTNLKKFKS